MKVIENRTPMITILGQTYNKVHLFSVANNIIIAESEEELLLQLEKLRTRKRLSRFEKNIIKKIYHIEM